jgi:hypothetical protein
MAQDAAGEPVGRAEVVGLAVAVGDADAVGLATGLIGIPASRARLASIAGALVLVSELTGVVTSALLHAAVKIEIRATIMAIRIGRLYRRIRARPPCESCRTSSCASVVRSQSNVIDCKD